MALADYDLIAQEYASAFRDELAQKPFDRAILTLFARLVSESGGRAALDAGCGPGHAAAELAKAGLAVEGVDLSPAMVSIAQARQPQSRFVPADMSALPYEDGVFDGVCAWYSRPRPTNNHQTRASPSGRSPAFTLVHVRLHAGAWAALDLIPLA